MITIGNYFAFGILLLIAMIFFRTKYFLTRASRYYAVCLTLTFLGTIINTLKAEGIHSSIFPLWLTKAFITLDLLLMSITTAMLTLYLISKITEHILDDKTLRLAKYSLAVTVTCFALFNLINLPLGYVFSIDSAGNYTDGQLSLLPYFIIIPEIALIFYYCIKYRKRLSRNTKFALIESVPIALFAILAKFIYKDVLILVLSVTLIELVFFLVFQRQRMGINSITKLHDGRSFYTEINKRIKQNSPFRVYLISIRNIGIIKQNFGHRAGDEILYNFAFSLERLIDDAAVFHMHGTNFTVVVKHDENTEEIKKTLISHLNTELTYMNQQLTLDYIIAEHTWKEDEANADIFYEKLEYARTVAKESKQKYIVYTLDLEIDRLRKKYLTMRMQRISSADGFEIWFQPIYSTAKKTFSSMEVLLRLKEKNGSFISPAEFIPLAEKTGQIIPITWFVIEETCKALAENPDLNTIRASINLPMLHLVNPNFEERLNRIVDGYGIPHEQISFEFTERVILDDLDIAEKNMKKLASSGYTFYLDDFGVGYSNFNCVLRLPLKTVKLDMSLTATAEKLRENNSLVCILTDLFHDMGLNVVAEGAETSEQVDILTSYGIDGIQGYYFAKPMPLEKLKKFLKKDQKSK